MPRKLLEFLRRTVKITLSVSVVQSKAQKTQDFLRGEYFLCHVFLMKSAQNLATAPAVTLSGLADVYVKKYEREIYRV